MTVLGCGLGFIYVPLNAFTQDVTLVLLNETALARCLGFLQGAKNTGLVIGYVVGPLIYHPGSQSGGGKFAHVAWVLAAGSLLVGAASGILRWPMRRSVEERAIQDRRHRL